MNNCKVNFIRMIGKHLIVIMLVSVHIFICIPFLFSNTLLEYLFQYLNTGICYLVNSTVDGHLFISVCHQCCFSVSTGLFTSVTLTLFDIGLLLLLTCHTIDCFTTAGWRWLLHHYYASVKKQLHSSNCIIEWHSKVSRACEYTSALLSVEV